MLPRPLFAFLATAVSAVACVCNSYEPVKACEIHATTSVIFRGRVDAGARPPLYRVHVLERFKGLGPDVSEVWIDPGAKTSCERSYKANAEYLFYVSQSPGGHVYEAALCNPSREIVPADPDLAYLRSASTRTGAFVEGRLVQNFDDSRAAADHAPVVDGTVRASAGTLVHTANTDAAGRYRIGPIAPGSFSLTAVSQLLGDGRAVRPRNAKVDLAPGSCAVVHWTFATNATIAGKVLDSDGNGVAHVRIRLPANGQDVASRWRTTATDGSFRIEGVPVGDLQIVADLSLMQSNRLRTRLVHGPMVSVHPSDAVTGIEIRIPEPLPLATLYVDVLWPDGSPAIGGARAFAGLDYQKAPPTSHRVALRLGLGGQYEIRADWLDAKFRHIEGLEAQSVDFTHDGQVVSLRLRSRP